MPERSRLIFVARPLLILLALLCAATARAAPREVRVGVFVTSISGIDFADGSFRISAFVWFIDPAGRLDPLREVRVLARQSTLQRVEQLTLPDGAIYTGLLLEAVVDQTYDLRDFPFSHQALTLALEPRLEVDKVDLVPDSADSQIGKFVRVPSWNIEGLQLVAARETYDSGFGHRTESPTFSRVNIVVSVARDRSPLIFEKFSGFIVALVITALVFAVPVNDLSTRLGMTTSSIFAAVFNRYRLEDSIGFDSSFGLMDQISLLTFSAILTALVISLLAHNLSGRRSPAAIKLIDRRLGLGSMLVYLSLIIVAFAVALT